MFHVTWITFIIQSKPIGDSFSVCHVAMANCPSYVHSEVIIEYRNSTP